MSRNVPLTTLRSEINEPLPVAVKSWVQGFVFLFVSLLALGMEVSVWSDPLKRNERLNGWLCGLDPDWLPCLPFCLLFPLCWWGFQRKPSRPGVRGVFQFLRESPREGERSLFIAWFLAAIVFAVAFGMSWRTGQNFEHLPPAYHDEYSYLIQAETFASGRWYKSSIEPHSELFDQLHVLNEGKFASRYFPGTGAWIGLFWGLGSPWWGHLLAQAFCAQMIFWIGRELSHSGTGLLAGLLFAVSPGLLLFSTLLLAHHPTLVGLTIFLWAFLKLMRTNSPDDAVIAGTGLAYAMLCRPMTAAGFALPFGIAFAWWWVSGNWKLDWPSLRHRGQEQTSHITRIQLTRIQRSCTVLAMGLPILTGFALIGLQNSVITGNFLKTPYTVYNEIYTPRHVYGFNNAVRGARESGPLVSDGYDRWAQNLTPPLAFENMQTRFLNSCRWTLGIVPIIAGGMLLLLTPRQGDRRWLLVGVSIFSLHLVHIPYWFSGIMGWHYVFETAPLWLLLLSEATQRLFHAWHLSGRWLMKYCWLVFLGTCVAVNIWTLSPMWPARLERGIVEVKYPRQIYARFRQQVDELRDGKPAIVCVLPDPADISMDYVTNSGRQTDPVLVARIRDRSQCQAVSKQFASRTILLFNAKQRQFEDVPAEFQYP